MLPSLLKIVFIKVLGIAAIAILAVVILGVSAINKNKGESVGPITELVQILNIIFSKYNIAQNQS